MRGEFAPNDDVFRQPPSPEVDAAWHNISWYGQSHVRREDIVRIGKDPETAVKFPPEFGFGDDAYAIETDLVHKIHCLDVVRRDVHFDHYYGKKYADGQRSELHAVHTDHCVYILLQSLLCSATTDIIPLTWMEDYPWPALDFSLNRKCANPNAVLKWVEQHSTESPNTVFTMKKPKGQKQRPADKAIRRLLEIEEGWDAKNGII